MWLQNTLSSSSCASTMYFLQSHAQRFTPPWRRMSGILKKKLSQTPYLLTINLVYDWSVYLKFSFIELTNSIEDLLS